VNAKQKSKAIPLVSWQSFNKSPIRLVSSNRCTDCCTCFAVAVREILEEAQAWAPAPAQGVNLSPCSPTAVSCWPLHLVSLIADPAPKTYRCFVKMERPKNIYCYIYNKEQQGRKGYHFFPIIGKHKKIMLGPIPKHTQCIFPSFLPIEIIFMNNIKNRAKIF